MKLLIPEPPLQVLPSLAAEIGLNEALLLQQIHYWTTCKEPDENGEVWVWKTVNEWRGEFPFWSESTIKRVVGRLKAEGYIAVRQEGMSRVNHYRVLYDAIHEVNLTPSGGHQVNLTPSTGQSDPITNTTESTQRDTSPLPTRKKEQPQASEVVQPSIERLCDLMARLQNERLGRSEYTASTTWKRDMRLLVEKDGRSPTAVERCLRWIHEHDFWSTNVLSPGKLRKQWNRLELEAKRDTKRKPAPEPEPEDDLPAKLRAQGRFEEAEEAEKWA